MGLITSHIIFLMKLSIHIFLFFFPFTHSTPFCPRRSDNQALMRPSSKCAIVFFYPHVTLEFLFLHHIHNVHFSQVKTCFAFFFFFYLLFYLSMSWLFIQFFFCRSRLLLAYLVSFFLLSPLTNDNNLHSTSCYRIIATSYFVYSIALQL